MQSGHVDNSLLVTASEAWPLFCQNLFDVAIDAVLPSQCLPHYLPDPSQYSAVKVLAFGKAAASMARVVEEQYAHILLSGIVICPHGTTYETATFEVIHASHPLPDSHSVKAAEKALEIARSTQSTELLLVLVSGGGSALMAKPVNGISLTQKRDIINRMMRAGAAINDINAVRRTLSAVKGGKLLQAAANAAHVLTLAISDVVNDDPTTIASGPTVPMVVASHDNVNWLLARYEISGIDVASQDAATIYPPHTYQIVASGKQALAATASFLQRAGFHVVDLGHDVEGEAREVASLHARAIIERCASMSLQPTVFLSGGELTVTVTGSGLGGPNQEYVLALMKALPAESFYAFAADTDGADGQGGAAGAMVTPASYQLAAAFDLSIDDFLNQNNSYNYFKQINCLFNAKYSTLNVNALRVVCWIP